MSDNETTLTINRWNDYHLRNRWLEAVKPWERRFVCCLATQFLCQLGIMRVYMTYEYPLDPNYLPTRRVDEVREQYQYVLSHELFAAEAKQGYPFETSDNGDPTLATLIRRSCTPTNAQQLLHLYTHGLIERYGGLGNTEPHEQIRSQTAVRRAMCQRVHEFMSIPQRETLFKIAWRLAHGDHGIDPSLLSRMEAGEEIQPPDNTPSHTGYGLMIGNPWLMVKTVKSWGNSGIVASDLITERDWNDGIQELMRLSLLQCPPDKEPIEAVD